MKAQIADWEKIFVKHWPHKDLYTECMFKTLKTIIKKQINSVKSSVKKWANDSNRYITKDDDTGIKNTHFSLEKRTSKPQWNTIIHQLQWPKLKMVNISSADKGMKELESSYIVGENVKWCSCYGKQFGSSTKS